MTSRATSADVLPGDAGAGVEVDAELVGVVEIAGADGVGVKLDAAEVHDPGEAGGVVDDDLFGGAAGGEGEGDGAEEGREVVGGAFLVERLGLFVGEACAVDETLEDDGPGLNTAERARCDGEEILDQVELRELDFAGEVEFCRVGNADLVAIDGEEFGVVCFGHGTRVHRRDLDWPVGGR